MMARWKITVKDAAEMVGMARTSLHRYTLNGTLPSELIGRERYVYVDDVIGLMEERRQYDHLLSVKQVAAILGLSSNHLCKEVKIGKLAHVTMHQTRGYLMDLDSVADYWRREMDSVCVRCGILGEATPELGFVCAACEYEKRTGRVYSWPICRNSHAVRHGRLHQTWGLVG